MNDILEAGDLLGIYRADNSIFEEALEIATGLKLNLTGDRASGADSFTLFRGKDRHPDINSVVYTVSYLSAIGKI